MPAKDFAITNVARSSNDVTVTWASVAGKTYRIESKDDLSQANWNLVQDQIVAAGASTAITNPGATALPHRFYRVAQRARAAKLSVDGALSDCSQPAARDCAR